MEKHDYEARKRIGQRIAELRMQQGMTQIQLSDVTGIHQPNIVRIEAGRYAANLDTLERIAKALGCTVDIVTK